MLIDTHCHLLLTVLAHGDVHRIMKNALDRGLSSMLDIAIGTGDFLRRCRLIDAITKRREVGIFMTAGLPPYYSNRRWTAQTSAQTLGIW